MIRRFLACLAVVAMTLIPAAGLASAQTSYEFKLGFGNIAQQIPDIVGSPLENEHSDPMTGDAIQRTTTGVLVWRKADNITAFTNGSTTWLLGPLGLQSRPNDARFGWEQAPSPAAALTGDMVSVKFGKNGNLWVGEGNVHNTTGTPIDAELDFAGYDAQGRLVIDTPTVFIPALSPGATKSFTARVPAVANVEKWTTSLVSWPVASRSTFSMDVGTSRPLQVDPALASAVNVLKTLDEGSWLLKVAADHSITIAEDYTGPGILGSFDPDTGDVTISTDLEDTSAYARAAVLAHELSHANNAVAGVKSDTPLQCYREENQAFTRQSQVWSQLWGNRLPSDQIDQYHAELNDISNTVTKDPQGFASELVSRYRSECGPVSAPPTEVVIAP